MRTVLALVLLAVAAFAQTAEPQIIVAPLGLPCELNALVGITGPCNTPENRGAFVHVKSADATVAAYIITLHWTTPEGQQKQESRTAAVAENGWATAAFVIGSLPYQSATGNIPGNKVTRVSVRALAEKWSKEQEPQ